MKFGIEVEGAYKGMRSLFVSADEFLSKSYKLAQAAQDYQVEQIYISDLSNVLDLNSPTLYLLSAEYHITVELTELKETPPEWIEIMYHVPAPSMQHLRPTDQVKLSHGLNVWATLVADMKQTVPEDFDGDINVG